MELSSPQVIVVNHLLVLLFLIHSQLVHLFVSHVDLLLGDFSHHFLLLQVDMLFVYVVQVVCVSQSKDAVSFTLFVHLVHVCLVLLELHGLLEFCTIVQCLHLFLHPVIFHLPIVGFSLSLDDSTPLVEISLLVSWVVPHLLLVEILDLLTLLLEGFLDSSCMDLQWIHHVHIVGHLHFDEVTVLVGF